MSRTIRWQVLLIGAGMALVATILAYLALTYTSITVPTVGGTYVEGVVGEPYAINPLLSSYNPVDQDLSSLIFSGLTRLNSHGQVEPDLAQSWEVSPDGLSYLFRLRAGVRWHDGSPFTADDVLYTVSLLQDPDYPGPSDLGELWRTVEIEKQDTYTIRFTMVISEPFVSFLDYTTIGLLPAHLLEDVQAADLPMMGFNLNPVGTGPFTVDEVEIEEDRITSILLGRNPRYYDVGPRLEHIRFRFYPTYQSAFRAYQEEEVEGLSRVTLENLAQAREQEGLNLYSAQLAHYALIFLNLNQRDTLPFFQEVEVRQALLLGLDRQGLVDQLLQGQGLVAHSPIVAGTWAYDEDIPRYPYDPERARILLDEADWVPLVGDEFRSKRGQTLAFTLLSSTDPIQIAIAEYVARQWNELGLQVTVETVAPLDLVQALEQRDYQAALVELSLPGDPDPYPFWHQTQVAQGQNYAGLEHRQMSEIIETARITVDPVQRAALYGQFQTLFAEEVPAILLYHPIYTYGVHQKIEGVQIGPMMYPSDRFATANLWFAARRQVIVRQGEAP